MKLKAVLSGLTLVLFCSVGIAQSAKKPINKKQAVQKQKITQGVKSGELTKKEATKLRAQQKNIALTKKAAKSDGVVTKKEKAVINQKQKAANQNILRKKNNAIKRKK
jgi:uncharacterized membrane protein